MIRKIYILCLFITCAVTKIEAQVTIQGKVGDYVDPEMVLYSCQNGFAEPCGSTQVGEGKSFSLTATIPTEGFYMLGNNAGVKHVLYLKGNEQLHVSFKNELLDILRGQTEEGKMLQAWENKAGMLRMQSWFFMLVGGGKSVEAEPFLADLQALKRQKADMEKTINTSSNENFKKLMVPKMESDVAFFKLAYRRSHVAELAPDFISDAELADYDRYAVSTGMIQLPFMPELLHAYVDYKAEKTLPAIENPTTLSSVELKQRAELLKDKVLRELYLYQVATQIRYYEKFTEMRETFKDDPQSERLEQLLTPLEQKLAWSKPGIVAPDFKGQRPNGQWLSLSDLKGKVVVIDVWATWCVPCLRMMPYFKQLEKELSNPDVAFMSVCVGASPEIDLWEKLVEKHELKGNVVFIQGWTRGFSKDYRVTGVPRFMIIDREGKVFSFAAPSPKYPQLKEMILKALQKN